MPTTFARMAVAAFAAALSLAALAADPRSDAPEDRVVPAVAAPVPPTYDAALAS